MARFEISADCMDRLKCLVELSRSSGPAAVKSPFFDAFHNKFCCERREVMIQRLVVQELRLTRRASRSEVC